MNEKLISVIVPVYNVERYLEKCIESICHQTFSNMEIILVDDGATDNSGFICDEWALRDSRIRVIHKENGGLSDARNAGIEIASGSWLAFIDSDDFITADTIERMYEAASGNDCQVSVCNMVRIYDDGTTESFYCPATELTVYRGNERLETLKQPSVCNKLFRADLFRDVRFPKGKFYEDTFVYHILAHQAKRIALTGHDGYYYRSRRESILGQPWYTDRYFDYIEAVHERVDYLIAYQVLPYDKEACLSLYAAVSNGEKFVAKTTDNEQKFLQMRNWYRTAYDYLMKCPEINFKQKLRLIVLRYLPSLHGKLY